MKAKTKTTARPRATKDLGAVPSKPKEQPEQDRTPWGQCSDMEDPLGQLSNLISEKLRMAGMREAKTQA